MSSEMEVIAAAIAAKAEAEERARINLYELQCAAVAEAAAVLKDDPSFLNVKANGATLEFSTDWIIATVRGIDLYIATYLVQLDERGVNGRPYIICTASGTIDPEAKPHYVFPTWDPPSFCLGTGSRRHYFQQLMKDLDYVSAAYLLLDSFAHLNERDEEFALGYYVHVGAYLVIPNPIKEEPQTGEVSCKTPSTSLPYQPARSLESEGLVQRCYRSLRAFVLSYLLFGMMIVLSW